MLASITLTKLGSKAGSIIILLLVNIAWLLVYYSKYKISVTIQEQGEIVEGKISKHWRGKSGHKYTVTLCIGEERIEADLLGNFLYAVFHTGDTINVKYLQKYPDKVSLDNSKKLSGTISPKFFIALFFITLVCLTCELLTGILTA